MVRNHFQARVFWARMVCGFSGLYFQTNVTSLQNNKPPEVTAKPHGGLSGENKLAGEWVID